MIGFFFRLILSVFLDKEGRNALVRRAQVSKLEEDLKIEMAKTNALIKALNKQGEQTLGISDKRQAEIAEAMQNQVKAQEALNELDPDTRRLMIERALADDKARQGLSGTGVNKDIVVNQIEHADREIVVDEEDDQEDDEDDFLEEDGRP